MFAEPTTSTAPTTTFPPYSSPALLGMAFGLAARRFDIAWRALCHLRATFQARRRPSDVEMVGSSKWPSFSALVMFLV